jgi:RNA polymerase sigma-70 factor (ECF subfamily)
LPLIINTYDAPEVLLAFVVGGTITIAHKGITLCRLPDVGTAGIMNQATMDASLLKRASQGDETAFLLLYERHRGSVFRFACRLLGSTTLAEDITQDCFFALLRKPDLFRPERASLRTYLCAAARNLAFKHLRKHGLEKLTDDPPEQAAIGPTSTPLQRIIDEEITNRVRKAVESLPPLQREAVILFEYEDLSLAEIAIIAETDVGTIKSRLHRARQRLKKDLAPWFRHDARIEAESV